MGQTSLLLASGSPRRRELLQQVGLRIEVMPAEIDESPRASEGAEAYVTRLAREKAEAIARRQPDRLVLGADTVVVLGDTLLGKPRDTADARRMLAQLSGQTHRVLTGVALAGLRTAQIRVETRVRFRALSASEIDWYVGTGEPADKAGAYAIQGLGAAFVESIQGSPSNVVGLPLAETLTLLEAVGWRLPWKAT